MKKGAQFLGLKGIVISVTIVAACVRILSESVWCENPSPEKWTPPALPKTPSPDAKAALRSVRFDAGASHVLFAPPEGFDAQSCRQVGVNGPDAAAIEGFQRFDTNQLRVTFQEAAAKPGTLVAFFWHPNKVDTPVRSYFASSSGQAANEGTAESPWDLRSALDGTHAIAPGSMVWIRGGEYSDPRGEFGQKRSYDVKLGGSIDSPIHVGPFPGEHVLINGGLRIHEPSKHVWVGGLEFHNDDPVPGGEPTPPGSVPDPLPKGFDEWGSAGIAVMSGENHVIYNNVTHGGGHAYSSWNKAPGTLFLGNIAFDAGWLGEDRSHGHCIYAQNQDGLGTKHLRHNLFCAGNGRKTRGSYSLHLYGTRVPICGFTVWENGLKGPTIVQSAKKYCDTIDVRSNVVQSLLVGDKPETDSNGNAFGKVGQADLKISLRQNVFINGVKRLENNGWESIDTEANRVVKTAPHWWPDDMGVPPAFAVTESGDYIDSTKPGVDEFRLWPNAYDQDRAHIAVLDFDKSGAVAINPSGFLHPGDHYRIHHYTDVFGKPLVEGIYWASESIDVKLVEHLDALDMFVLFRAK